MTGNSQRESAKIYQFPKGGRAGLEAERAALRQPIEPMLPRAKVVYGAGWYHDEAVRDDEPVGQR
jgi:hypothetical protein